MNPSQRSLRPARSTIRCASSCRRPTTAGRRPWRRRRSRRCGPGGWRGRCRSPPQHRGADRGAGQAAGERRCMRNAYSSVARSSSAAVGLCSPTHCRNACLWQGRTMRHRHRLPQLDAARPFLTDGGLETTLIFHRGLDLPVFRRLRPAQGRSAAAPSCATTSRPTSPSPASAASGFVLDTATWRANPDWGGALGYSLDDLDAANRAAVALAEEIRAAGEADGTPIVINGVIGPRGDGYEPGELMSRRRGARPTTPGRSRTFAGAAVDMVTAVTMTYADEAIGIARAARAHGVPVVDLLHARDRRAPARRPVAARRHRARRRRDRRVGRLLHDQLRAPVALRRRARARRRLARADRRPARQRVGQEPRRARRGGRSSTRATPRRSAPSTARCARTWARSRCSAAAAAPTGATSRRSGAPGWTEAGARGRVRAAHG